MPVGGVVDAGVDFSAGRIAAGDDIVVSAMLLLEIHGISHLKYELEQRIELSQVPMPSSTARFAGLLQRIDVMQGNMLRVRRPALYCSDGVSNSARLCCPNSGLWLWR